MANETEMANFAIVNNVISDGITPALVNPAVVGPLIRYEALPVGTAVKLFRKDGSLTAETIAESTAHAVDAAGQELTQSSITATAVKLCANCIVTVEAEQFVGVSAADMVRYLGEALARDWDDEILALFAGFANGVTAGSVLTINDALEAAYTVVASTNGVANGSLRAVLDYKGAFELQKELTASSAAHLAQPAEIALLQGARNPNGFIGSKANIDFYQTSGVPTSGSDDVGLVFHPELAFGAMISPTPRVDVRWLGGSDATRGYATEVSAILFCDVIEWNDGAGCMLKSDT